MRVLTDADLCQRGAETLLASWEQYARGATGAAVRRFPGVAAAVFPNQPERAVYNNAVLQRDLAPAERADALDAMRAACAAAGVARYAAAPLQPAQVNGYPALILRLEGEMDTVVAVRIDDGVITGLYAVRNPEKLSHMQHQTALNR